jgi:hypothetical protein
MQEAVMGNINDYTREETHDLSERPFNAVDALVLASLAYCDVPDEVPRLSDIMTKYGTLAARARLFDLRHPIASLRTLCKAPFEGPTLAEVNACLVECRAEPADSNQPNQPNQPTQIDVAGFADPQLTNELYAAAASSPRFAGIRISAYDQRFSAQRQTQFAAETMQLPDGTLAVAFQGTDDSFVGWKEDFNMAFQYPVPAQEAASDYLQSVARVWNGPIMLLGHSKGGNLAVHAAMNAADDIQKRIVRVFSLDGPGFPSEVVTSPRYQAIVPKVEKIVPDSSIVGMILETPEPCVVVRSDQKGIMQHMAFSWQVQDGAFEVLPAIAPSSQYFNTSLNEWLGSLSHEQRQRAVDALFSILAASGTDHFSGVLGSLPKALPEMIGSFAGLSDEDRRNILFAANLLIRSTWSYRWRAQRGNGSDA